MVRSSPVCVFHGAPVCAHAEEVPCHLVGLGEGHVWREGLAREEAVGEQRQCGQDLVVHGRDVLEDFTQGVHPVLVGAFGWALGGQVGEDVGHECAVVHDTGPKVSRGSRKTRA